MSHVTALRCRECGSEYDIEPTNACELCFGPLEVSYDYDSIAKSISRETIQRGPTTMWRYHDFLPVAPDAAVDIGTGFTPLLKADNLGRRLGLNELYVKNDAVNPTNSFKDRPVTVTTSKALEFEFDVLACPSTGNLMGSVAAHGARAGMKTMVFFPADLERGKIIQAASYGPTLVAVDGNYDQVNRLCSELADNNRWAFVNINMRPFYAGGQQDAGPRGGRAAWLEGPRPLRSAGRVRRAAYEDMEGARGDGAGRPDRPARRPGCISPRRRDALP